MASIPESTTAQQTSLQCRSNSSVAASALIVLRERCSAGRAGRLRLIDHSSGRPGGGRRGTIAERLGGEVDEQVVGQPVGRLVVGLVVVGVLRLPGDPADEPVEPDQRARQLTGGGRLAALLAHRLLQAGDDLARGGLSTVGDVVVSAGQRYSCHQFDSGRTLRSISSNVSRTATCDWL